MSNIKAFGKMNMDAALQSSIGGRKKQAWLKIESGKPAKRVRVFPPFQGDIVPWKECKRHFIQMPGAQFPAVFACAKVLDPLAECVGCELCDKMAADPRPAQQEFAKRWKAGYRAFVWVIDRDSPAKPIPLELPWGIIKEFRAYITLGNAKYMGDFTDANTGRDILIGKTGVGLNTNWDVSPDMQGPSPLGSEDQIMEWITAIDAEVIEKKIRVMTSAEIRALIAESSNSGQQSQPAVTAASQHAPVGGNVLQSPPIDPNEDDIPF